MRAPFCWRLAVVIALSGLPRAHSAEKKDAGPGSAQEKLVGAWRLAWLEEEGADGKVYRPDCIGLLVYTRDGHMSVQVMYRSPKSRANTGPLQYAQGGYEASFGTYKVDERAHTFTYHVEGALVRTLIGKDLTRVFEFSGTNLMVKSTSQKEHWKVAWEHY